MTAIDDDTLSADAGMSSTASRPRRRRWGWPAVIAGVSVAVALALVAWLVHPVSTSRPHPASTTPPVPVVRLTAAAHAIVDSRGQRWLPTTALAGGRVETTSVHIGGTASPDLYRTARVGLTALSVPVSSTGTYAVDLMLADPTADRPGQRVFDVVATGQVVAAGVDPYRTVGRASAFHVMFTVPVAGPRLELTFSPKVGEPMVSALAVAPYDSQLQERLMWSDEFNGQAGAPVDASWNHETGGSGWGSQELEYYTDRTANAQLDGQGHLAIVAQAESYTGPDNVTREYTSARLDTLGHFSTMYGRIDVRAQLPVGKGLWPGAWALGTDLEKVGYPRSGEIDFEENNGEAGVVLGHIHGPDTVSGTYAIGTTITGSDTSGFHDYSVLWTPVGLEFLLDGAPYFAVGPSDLPASSAWVFDKPFYLLLDLAVGGVLPGSPDSSTPFPARFLVDYVRVYR
jgi:beta-glucanase (GH16 family)